jgi:hypothetical protein
MSDHDGDTAGTTPTPKKKTLKGIMERYPGGPDWAQSSRREQVLMLWSAQIRNGENEEESVVR